MRKDVKDNTNIFSLSTCTDRIAFIDLGMSSGKQIGDRYQFWTCEIWNDKMTIRHSLVNSEWRIRHASQEFRFVPVKGTNWASFA